MPDPVLPIGTGAYYNRSMTTISCKIPEKLDAELEAMARLEGVPKSTLVRRALERQLKAASHPSAPTAHDLVKKWEGCLTGPRDLSTNSKHLEGFGG